MQNQIVFVVDHAEFSILFHPVITFRPDKALITRILARSQTFICRGIHDFFAIVVQISHPWIGGIRAVVILTWHKLLAEIVENACLSIRHHDKTCIIAQHCRQPKPAAASYFYKTGRRKLVIHVLSMWGEEPSHYFLQTVLQGGEANCPAVV